MSSCYNKNLLNRLADNHSECIIVFKDDSVKLGYFVFECGDYCLKPFNINSITECLFITDIKQIILFNGAVLPKQGRKIKVIDIIALNELVNKAGYEFI